MNRNVKILALATLLCAGAARADEDCAVPMTDWQPREAVARLAAEKGWTVRRIKIDDGCYEIIGTDAAGKAIEVKIHPGTLAVTALEYEQDDERDGEDGHDRKGDD